MFVICRFIARRGHVEIITSDNGSNFIGVNLNLERQSKNLITKRITQPLNSKNITWKFNPSPRPWMGASWELLIKSVKRILRSIPTDKIFIDKTLPIYLFELESIFNKRPLTPISNNIRDFGVIKPNHLLTGYQNDENSFTNSIHCIKDLQNPCKTVQSCANIFWNCWTNYQLPTPASRTRWANS